MKIITETLNRFGINTTTKEVKKRLIIAVVVFMLLIIALIYVCTPPKEESEIVQPPDSTGVTKQAENTTNTISTESTEKEGPIIIDVSGAVKSPMVIELESGSRVNDAIEACGGLAENATTTQINLAALLSDGEKVYVPTNEEVEAGVYQAVVDGSGASSGSGTSATGKININTADEGALQQITGVGPSTAKKIVDYRQSNGRFQSIEDLKNISGIGEKTFAKMQDQITV
jgi:competence protein ComEA